MYFRCSTALLSSRGISILTVRITHHTDSVIRLAGFFMNGRGSYLVEQTYFGSYRSLLGKGVLRIYSVNFLQLLMAAPSTCVLAITMLIKLLGYLYTTPLQQTPSYPLFTKDNPITKK